MTEGKEKERKAPKFPRREGPLDPAVIAKTIVDNALKEDDKKKESK